jgi:nitrogen fixation protein FixH
MILLMISGFLAFSAWAAGQAAGLGSKVTDADYYGKGLKYNTGQVERRAAETLGWNLTTQLSGRDLEFHLTDRAGGAVARAIGTLYLAIPGAAENLHLPLPEVTPGTYRVRLDDTLSGPIPARLELARAGALINRPLLLNL